MRDRLPALRRVAAAVLASAAAPAPARTVFTASALASTLASTLAGTVVSTLACTRNAPDSGAEGATVVEHLRVDGEPRTYRLHLPAHYATLHRVPLVLAFHGHGDDAAAFESATGISDEADDQGFIAVYPQALGDPTDWHTGVDGPRRLDDVDFTRELIRVLTRAFRVDRHRIYAAGHSNGGIMVYRLASLLSGRLAAIAVSAGTIGMVAPNGDTTRFARPRWPVPVLAFHGLADTGVPYDGGAESDGPANVISAANTIRFWAAADHCPLRPPTRTVSADSNIVVDRYAPCAAGSEVVLYTIIHGTHRWPGDDQPWWTFPPAPTTDLNATDVMWRFFAAHRLRR